MGITEQYHFSTQIEHDPPDDIELYVIGLISRLEGPEHQSLDEAAAAALAEIDATKIYDLEHIQTRGRVERAIQFLRDEGVK